MEQHSMRSAHGAMRTGARLGLAGIGVFAFLVSSAMPVGAVADEQTQLAPVPTTGMHSGKVTAKHDTSIEINGREYALHQKITIADDQGNEAVWADFKKGDEVQFHLKQERIDYLILVLPR